MASTLFSQQPTRRWSGGRNVVPYTGDNRCARCGATRLLMTYDQAALFIHGGYGATDRITIRACFCGTDTDLRTVNPRLAAV